MTSHADRIDPRLPPPSDGRRSRIMVPIEKSDLIAASDEIRTLTARVAELEAQVAVARKLAIEEMARIVERSAGEDPDDVAAKLRALSPTLSLDALVERGGQAVVAFADRLPLQSEVAPILRSHRVGVSRAVLQTIGLGTGMGG